MPWHNQVRNELENHHTRAGDENYAAGRVSLPLYAGIVSDGVSNVHFFLRFDMCRGG